MFGKRQSSAKEPKPVAPVLRNAYGHPVEREIEAEVAFMEPAPIEKLRPLRKATMTVRERPIVPVLKTTYDLPDAERKRLWSHVASIPCQYPHCGVVGVQVAHLSLLTFGKGMGLKVPDAFVAALCPTHHVYLDSSNTADWDERLPNLLLAGYRTMCELLMRRLIRPV
jgi:hypothetical protein